MVWSAGENLGINTVTTFFTFCIKSGMIHIIHKINGEKVASGTRFMVERLLVTNYHVADTPPPNSVVVIRTINSSPDVSMEAIFMTNYDFLQRTKTASDDRAYDYIMSG